MYSRNFIVFMFLIVIIVQERCGAAVLQKKRDVNDGNVLETKTICQKSSPCGWAVYNRFSREIDYFMRNKCECTKGETCVRTDDDISVSAYVYRCKDENKLSSSY